MLGLARLYETHHLLRGLGGNTHRLRPTPVRKKPRNNDAARGRDGPPGDNSGENWGGWVGGGDRRWP